MNKIKGLITHIIDIVIENVLGRKTECIQIK